MMWGAYMYRHGLGVRIFSVVLAALFTINSGFGSFLDKPRKPDPAPQIEVKSVESVNGNTRQLKVQFNTDVRFTDNDPATHIYASGSDKAKDITEGVKLLSGTSGCSAIDPTYYYGNVYASTYLLTFQKDIPQNGYLCLVENTATGAHSNLNFIASTDGGALNSKKDKKKKQVAATEYRIPETLLGASVVSPTQAVIFFNYPAEFIVKNIASYISADNSTLAAPQTFTSSVRASSCEKIDDSRYLVTFAGSIPDSGVIKIKDSQSKNSKSKKAGDTSALNLVHAADGGSKLRSTFNYGGFNYAGVSFTNSYIANPTVQYLDENTARITFPSAVRFLGEDPEKNIDRKSVV